MKPEEKETGPRWGKGLDPPESANYWAFVSVPTVVFGIQLCTCIQENPEQEICTKLVTWQ